MKKPNFSSYLPHGLHGTAPMTKKEVKDKIHSFGILCQYNSDLEEWQIWPPNNKAASYFTTDAQDAIGTAQYMAKEISNEAESR